MWCADQARRIAEIVRARAGYVLQFSPIRSETGSQVNTSGLHIMDEVSLCARLGEWVHRLQPQALSVEARLRAQCAIRDTIACMIAGIDADGVREARDGIAGWSDGRSQVLGDIRGRDAPWAALINGTAAHALDFDDNFLPATSHASAVLVPALLALGDELDVTIGDMIVAYVAGLEVQARLGSLINPFHYERGWHATSTLGTIGATAACAKILSLSASQIAHALSIATSLAAGSKRQFGTTVKPLHAGLAAMHGVLAARLARGGIRGRLAIMESDWGFLSLHSAGKSIRSEVASKCALAIEEFGLVAKLYPSCMSSHLGIQALLALREEGLSATEVVAIDIALHPAMAENLQYGLPQTVSEARFSMPYCAAVALLDGRPRLEHFTSRAINRPEIWRLASLVSLEADPDGASSRRNAKAVVRVTLADGSRRQAQATDPKGSPTNTLNPSEWHEKIHDCCCIGLSAVEAGQLVSALFSLEDDLSTRQLTSFFAGARSRPALDPSQLGVMA